MVEFAIEVQYFGLAVAASTAAAQVRHLVAGLFGGFEQRLLGRYLEGYPWRARVTLNGWPLEPCSTKRS